MAPTIGVPSSQTLGNSMRVAVHLLGYAFDELLGLLADIVVAIQGSGDGGDRAVGFSSNVFEGNTHSRVLFDPGASRRSKTFRLH